MEFDAYDMSGRGGNAISSLFFIIIAIVGCVILFRSCIYEPQPQNISDATQKWLEAQSYGRHYQGRK